eukprot:NODE_245_length_12995_cov_0.297922.p3 type:complete len:254 gc:universal NODE_245_length_12995_cov_0.297922:10414-9653(-)
MQWRFELLPPVILVLALWTLRSILELIPPVKQAFFLDDASLQYPLLPSTVSDVMLILLSIVIPFFIILAIKQRDSFNSLCGLMIGTGLVENLTTIIKVSVGRLRPHFISVCEPEYPSNRSYDYMHPFYSKGCHDESNYLTINGRKSFPSGHSSMSYAGLGYLSLLIYSKYGHLGNYARILSFLPLWLAAYISLSRILDYHHHIEDVFFGGLMGILGSYLSFYHFRKIDEVAESIEPFLEEDNEALPLNGILAK